MEARSFIHAMVSRGPASARRALLTWGFCFWALMSFASVLHAANTIQTENAKPGTPDWEWTNPAVSHEIEGYASLTSVSRGGEISFYVSTTDPYFTIDIFRVGWYQGLGGRRMLSTITLPGVLQTMPTPDATTGLIECDWTVSYTLSVPNNLEDPSDWASGVYVALLTASTSGKQRYIVFVVRDDARASSYFFQCAANTYQAYNNWGGKSIYDFNSGGHAAAKVSFNRPYASGWGYDGAGDFFAWEYGAIRFLEREGYDLTYGTDVDAHANSSIFAPHQAVLIVGHSEYWSGEMRAHAEAARDAGVHLGFLAANICYWQVRFESSSLTGAPHRTMVGYKDYAKYSVSPGPDPYYTACMGGNNSLCPLVTVRWREAPLNLPENALLGVMYTDNPVDGDIVITHTSNWVFNRTGLKDGDLLPDLLGYEVDSVANNGATPPGLAVLAESPYTTTDGLHSGTAHMTVYTAASGALVFATGSIQFSWGLDSFVNRPDNWENFAAQQMTRNLLAAFINDQPPVADAGGPYHGAAEVAVQFHGENSSDPESSIAAYQWDFGDGATATGSAPTHAYSVAGTYHVTLIVTDGEGSRNAALTTATISGEPVAVLSPASVSFGNRLVGTRSTAHRVTLTNTGTDALHIAGIAVTGDFTETHTCGASLGAGENCDIDVVFAPAAPGALTGALSVTDDAAGSPRQVSLSGNGTAPAVSLSVATLSFGLQALGSGSPAQSVQLANHGTAALTIANLIISGDFAQSNDCGATVAVDGHCAFQVTFTPSAVGPKKGTFRISHNAPGNLHEILLTGVGTALRATPSSLDFGSRLVGSPSPASAVTITNLGASAVRIWNSMILGNERMDFGRTGSCPVAPATLAGGGNCTINVVFTPSAAGARNAELLLSHDAGGGVLSVSLTGTGQAAMMPAMPAVATSLPGGVMTMSRAAALFTALNVTGRAAPGHDDAEESSPSARPRPRSQPRRAIP